ncbi:polyprotein [Frankliniella fusca]|uniref:Polyprotein n=1 Tax=Frankliniella fusca TaxID=407009 RepID=A0AAE1HGX1_9NEOP|nr:polyprotein [Frankliniella fusca]KAK3920385.1 polyprotein [Frankliniella fusca]
MACLDTSNLFLVVKFDDDELGEYWAVPFSSVDNCCVWVDMWEKVGYVQSMACNVCVIFNGIKDVPLDLSRDPLGKFKCPECTRKPKNCLRSAKVVFGPRANLCCVLESYEMRVSQHNAEGETEVTEYNDVETAGKIHQYGAIKKHEEIKPTKCRLDPQPKFQVEGINLNKLYIIGINCNGSALSKRQSDRRRKI